MKYTKDSFEAMKQRRNLPFLKRGMRVEVDGKPGKVISSFGHNLWVKFDGRTRGSNCHPHYMVRYFSLDGTLLKEYKN